VSRGLAGAVAAEFIGTALLLAVVVGSGIMGERLAGGNVAIALLANSFATGCGLFVLIVIFAPLSGSHFNPLVSILARFQGALDGRAMVLFIVAQVAGALAGSGSRAWHVRPRTVGAIDQGADGAGQWLAEGVATFGLMLAILGARRYGTVTVAAVVGAYIAGAYWFTASTSFANPAVTLARALTPTFAGIAPEGVLAFVIAQSMGAGLGAVLGIGLFRVHSV
jgi:glycerol uptake facilitator-like aquaporin